MRRKQQGNTFPDISSRLSFIKTCQTSGGFLLPSVWIGATLRPKSEIFIFESFLNQLKLLRYYQWSSQSENKDVPKRKFVIVSIEGMKIRVKGCSTH